MMVWVLYDIENDRARRQAAKRCLQAGLYRVQMSCFVGTLTPPVKDTLQLQLAALIDEDKDRVYLLPMNQAELRQTVLLGQAFDKNLVADEVLAMLF